MNPAIHEPEPSPRIQPIPAKRFGFVMEMQAGMRTQYANWRAVVEADPTVEAVWAPITYWEKGGWIERMRFLPQSVKAAWRSNLQTERGLGRDRFDAVLFNTFNPAVTHPSSLGAYPCFLMFDVTPIQYDSMSRWYGNTPDRPGRLADWKMQQVSRAFSRAAGLFAWSNWAAQSAIDDYGADPAKVMILPPGVDAEQWKPRPGLRAVDSVTRILFTGGNFERKGGDLLLRWAAETDRKDWEIHLVTQDKPAVPPGVYLHNDLGSNAEGLIELASRCDLFVLPTRADCYSIASLEAMAAALPVITTRVGGIEDIVVEGETGYLLEPDDYDTLRDMIEFLIDNPAHAAHMGENGRRRILERYAVKDLVQRGLNRMAEGAG